MTSFNKTKCQVNDIDNNQYLIKGRYVITTMVDGVNGDFLRTASLLI